MNAPIKLLFGYSLLFALLMTGNPAHGLVIQANFDSTITNDSMAAVIESTISAAILNYEARFADPITVTIQFKEISTAGLYGHSSWWGYTISYAQYLAALQKDASTTNDTLALANLPAGPNNPVTGTSNIRVKTANLKALGFTGYKSGLAGGYDGIIGLHTSQLNLSRPSTSSTKGDLLATVEHEMDEVLGLSSSLDSNASDPLPEDLFRYTAEASRSYTTNGDDAYFSLDGSKLLARFNQKPSEDFGDWWTAGAHNPQVQDAFATNGKMPNPYTELIALDVIGYNLLPAPHPLITHTSALGTQLLLTGTAGLAGGTYVVLTSTSATSPLSQWSRIATNYLIVNGGFTFTNIVNPTEPRRFFSLQLQ